MNSGIPVIWVFIAFYMGIYYGKDGLSGAFFALLRAMGLILAILFGALLILGLATYFNS